MNKLVSKNPVQRFKQGKKIQKMEKGTANGKSSNEKFSNWLNSVGPKIFSLKPTGGGLLGWINKQINGTTNNQQNIQQQNTYKTPELKGSKEAYLNRLKQQGFTAKPTKPIVKTTPVVKKQSVVPRSGWSYGYDRSNEISDIKAVQDMLRNGGFYAKGANSRSDGAWGKDTELAYQNYLKSW